jgi:guanylate kinase
VLIGPGGAGKGTVARELTARDDRLWLSRSWTTRARRPGEDEQAYVFVDEARFAERAADGGFLEWAEFLGHHYGTPVPEPPPGDDVLLEIDVQGAGRVRELDPEAVVILLLPPSDEIQAIRLAERGDPADQVARRLEKGRHEVAVGRALADAVVVNDQVATAVDELAAIVERARGRSG